MRLSRNNMKTNVNLEPVLGAYHKRKFKFDDVKSNFTKVAFDIYRKNDAPKDELWQIQSADDGDYIIALYDEEKVATASFQPWSVVIKNADLHVFYKQEHLCKVASTQLGFQESDLSLAKQYLPSKLASNKNLVKALLNTVDHVTQRSILSKYPELA